MAARLLSLTLTCLAFTALGQPTKDAGTAPAPKKPAPAITMTDTLSTPESVLHDAESDTYLVGNINGSPLDRDGNGFISEFSVDGKLLGKLVESGKQGATLNAPKGLALSKGVLYVADIDTLRLFDRKTGAAQGEVKVPGATFLNDVFVAPSGLVYVTDSGLKMGKGGLEPNGTDGIYSVEPGKKPTLKTVLKSKALAQPNGIVVTADTIYVAPFGASSVHVFDLNGKAKGAALPVTKGSLDGLLLVGDRLIVSSWESKSVWAATIGGPFTEILTELNAPADLGFDSKRNRVLVPHFMDSKVTGWDLK